MDKVILPKEVAEAIEHVWEKECGSNSDRFNKHIALTNWNDIRNNVCNTKYMTLVGYACQKPIEYMTALVNGYEVEQTPEDKVRDYYKGLIDTRNDLSNDLETRDWAQAEAHGVRKTLDLLNIESVIKGVNA